MSNGIGAETGGFHVVRQSGSESTPMALNDYLTLNTTTEVYFH